jgi:hypothetical protein
LLVAALCCGLASAANLTGLWVGTGYTCGSTVVNELVRIDQTGDSFTASKLSGDPCVPAGGPTFYGKLNGNTASACTVVLGTTDCPACTSAPCTLQSASDNAFQVNSHGLSFTRSSAPLNAQLTLTGCSTCRIGDRLTVQAHVTNLGSSAVTVEVKVGMRNPGGTPSSLLGGYVAIPFPAGFDSTVTLYDAPIPTGMQAGIWTFEAALLEPELGLTLTRVTQTFTVGP